MASDLLPSVERLYIGSKEQEMQDDDCIDEKLSQQRPRKRTTKDPNALRKQIEDNFLSPPTSFGLDWLNRLQQYVADLTSPIGYLLTLSTDDGISPRIIQEFMRCRPRRRGPSFDLRERVWKVE